jgi:hypothetical protein
MHSIWRRDMEYVCSYIASRTRRGQAAMASGYKVFSIALQETTIIKHVKPVAIIVGRNSYYLRLLSGPPWPF